MMTTTQPNHADDPSRPSVALAKVAPDQSFALALEPSDFQHAMSLAKIISDSGMWAPKGQAKLTEQQALMRLMTGRNLGIPAVIAMQHVYDLYGRTGISAALKQALVQRHPQCEIFEHVSSDTTQATWKVKRKGSPEQLVKFTIEDAKRAGLVKPDSNYEKFPRRMMQARARSEAADIWFPDATMGLPTIDELEDEMVGEVVPSPGSPPPQAATRDWAAEADVLKQAVTDAANSGKKEDAKAVRELIAKFSADAPEEHGKSLQALYNMLLGKKKESAKTDATAATTAQAATTTAPAANPHPYLPPNQRGDNYEGPDEPPIPFGGAQQGKLV
jgi:hypothetical protein